MTKPKFKQSETRVINRSDIQLAHFNPRKITPEARQRLKRNIKNIGMLGGLVWNETTGNLVSGHQRIMILDELQHYDPQTKENDYKVKVEVVNLSEQSEKEQNIFFNSPSAQGEYDADMLSALITEIDIEAAGLDVSDLNILIPDSTIIQTIHSDEIKTDFQSLEKLSDQEREARKEAVKQAKEQTKAKMSDEATGDPFVILSFSSYENKVFFMELIGELPEAKYVKGEPLAEMLNEQQ